MHWFRRVDGYDMFGEETGHVMLTDVTSVGPSQEIMGRREAENLKGSCNDLQELEKEEGSPSGKEKVTVYSFIVKSKDGYTRIFRCSSESEREVSKKGRGRRKTKKKPEASKTPNTFTEVD